MYRIIGGDGQEYGPVSASEVRQWIAEGRLNAQSSIRAEESTEWTTLGALPEFAGAARPAASPAFSAAPGAAPQPFATGADGSRAEALRRIRVPATGLLVTGLLAVALSVFGLFIRVLALLGRFSLENFVPPSPELAPLFQQVNASLRQPFGLVTDVIGLAAFVLVVFGALRMKALRSYGLAFGISILAMLPCQCCCVLGLPFGIWALVLLTKPEIKSQFT